MTMYICNTNNNRYIEYIYSAIYIIEHSSTYKPLCNIIYDIIDMKP